MFIFCFIVNLFFRFTNSGWINGPVFEEVIIQFVKEVKLLRIKFSAPTQPYLLLLDGHVTRLNINLWRYCTAHNILVIIFPAHTSQILQPLDHGLNARFKRLLCGIGCFPGKRQWARKLIVFIIKIVCVMGDAHKEVVIRACFLSFFFSFSSFYLFFLFYLYIFFLNLFLYGPNAFFVTKHIHILSPLLY
jgi:hypothetical protein